MIRIEENFPLKSLNTFGMDVKARRFAMISTSGELNDLISSGILTEMPLLILGGGSNILFTSDFEGLVLKVENKGIEVVSENEDFVRVRAAAGEEWDGFVSYCVGKGYGGIENLSLIPGNVGSCPIQNIGAYGVEVKDCFQSLEAVNLQNGEIRIMEKNECRFGYRDSIFKQELKGKYLIWSVTFRLSKNPEIHPEYGAIARELQQMNISQPGIADVSKAVTSIRRSKLPDPAVIGNAGSFFKNPAIPAEKADMLRASYPGLVSYLLPDGNVKLAAGWLIEQCRWNGFRRGDAGVHPDQSLVLVNYSSATGQEILDLAEDIRMSVLEKFDVMLEIEVNIL